MINGRHVAYRGGMPQRPATGRLFIEDTGIGTQLFYDEVFGRLFRSNEQQVKDACRMIIEQNREDNCNYNDFYAMLRLSQTDIGAKYGWRRANYGNHKGLISFILTLLDKKSILSLNSGERIICVKPNRDSMPYENWFEI